MEIEILNAIQHWRTPVLDRIMLLATHLGDGGALWLVAALVLLLLPKTRRIRFAVSVSLLLEVLCCNVILKPLVGRIRPRDVNQAVTLLVPRPLDYSFPSGHTGGSFAAVSALYFGKKKLWIPCLVLACLIAFSRLYLYVHFPTDVLAGAALGILTGWAGERTTKAVCIRCSGGRAADA